MNFNSLNVGSPIFVLTKTSTVPVMQIGVLKSKVPLQNFNLDITATFDGVDKTFRNVPFGSEIATEGNDIFSGDAIKMQMAIESEMQASQQILNSVEYHRSMIEKGSGFIEKINPKYAKEKQQEREIAELKRKQKESDKKLDKMLEMLAKILPATDNAD